MASATPDGSHHEEGQHEQETLVHRRAASPAPFRARVKGCGGRESLRDDASASSRSRRIASRRSGNGRGESTRASELLATRGRSHPRRDTRCRGESASEGSSEECSTASSSRGPREVVPTRLVLHPPERVEQLGIRAAIAGRGPVSPGTARGAQDRSGSRAASPAGTGQIEVRSPREERPVGGDRLLRLSDRGLDLRQHHLEVRASREPGDAVAGHLERLRNPVQAEVEVGQMLVGMGSRAPARGHAAGLPSARRDPRPRCTRVRRCSGRWTASDPARPAPSAGPRRRRRLPSATRPAERWRQDGTTAGAIRRAARGAGRQRPSCPCCSASRAARNGPKMGAGNWTDAASTMRCASIHSRRWIWTSKLFRSSPIRPGQYSPCPGAEAAPVHLCVGSKSAGWGGGARRRFPEWCHPRAPHIGPGGFAAAGSSGRGLRGRAGILQRPVISARRSRISPRSRWATPFPGAASSAWSSVASGASSSPRAAHQACEANPSLGILRGSSPSAPRTRGNASSVLPWVSSSAATWRRAPALAGCRSRTERSSAWAWSV
jgi:hypothetical protein